MSNSYSTSAYFWGRSFATLPFDILLPFLFIVICYFACHLDNSAGVFFLAVLSLELVYWQSASYGLFISTLFKDMNTAMTLVPVLLIPLMLLAGFFVSLDQTPKLFYAIAYLSPFKYGFQALITNQYRSEVDCGNGVYCNLLETRFRFPEGFWLNLVLLACIGAGFRIAAWIALYIISNPKRVVLDPPKLNREEETNLELRAVEIEMQPTVKI